MFCSKCGIQNARDLNFCRNCGTGLETSAADTLGPVNAPKKDLDEMTGSGLGSVFIGDGFLMVALILAATNSSVSSLLWLLLLIPAFYFFGKGFADIFHARQIRRRSKQNELTPRSPIAGLPAGSLFETIRKQPSGDLVPVPSVTERTTRDLK